MSQEEQEHQEELTKKNFRPKFFSYQKWTSMKIIFGGIKRSFWTWGFLNCLAQRFYLYWSLILKTKSCSCFGTNNKKLACLFVYLCVCGQNSEIREFNTNIFVNWLWQGPKDNLWCKTTFDRKLHLMEGDRRLMRTLDERQSSMEDNLWGKTTFNGRWMMNFNGRWLLIDDDLWWKTIIIGRWALIYA